MLKKNKALPKKAATKKLKTILKSIVPVSKNSFLFA